MNTRQRLARGRSELEYQKVARRMRAAIQIADAMEKLASDNYFRSQLIEKGRGQRQKFSWDMTAQRLWACIEKAMK